MSQRNDTENFFHYSRLLKEVQGMIVELSAQSKSNPSYKHIWHVYQKVLDFERKDRELNSMLYDTLPQSLPEMYDPVGTSQAILNDRDGILVAQKASNGYEAITACLKQIRQIAIKSATGTTDTASLNENKNQIASLLVEVKRISENSKFNNLSLLDADGQDSVTTTFLSLTIQVGSRAGDTHSMVIYSATPRRLNLLDLQNDTPDNILAKIDTAILDVNDSDFRVGHDINQLRSAQDKSKEDMLSVAQSMENSLRDVASYLREMAQFYYSICPKKDIPSILE